jgi:hypothetical protein
MPPETPPMAIETIAGRGFVPLIHLFYNNFIPSPDYRGNEGSLLLVRGWIGIVEKSGI